MSHDAIRKFAWPTLVALLYFAGAASALLLTRGANGIATLWPSNGLLLAACLSVAASHLARYLAFASAASLLANLWGGSDLGISFAFTVANTAAVLLAACLLRRLCPSGLSFISPGDVGRFCLATVIGAGAGALIAATAVSLSGRVFAVSASWFVTDLLGTLIVTPLVLIWLAMIDGNSTVSINRSRTEIAVLLGAFLLVTAGVFAQSSFPLLFLPLAALLVVTHRLGVFGAASGVVLIAVVGSIFTSFALGPVSMIKDGHGVGVLFFQFYLVVVFASALPLAALLAARQRLTRQVEQSERIYRGLVERSRAVIFETDAEGRWTFLSPAWTTLTGLQPGKSLGASYAAFICPDDRLTAGDKLAPLYAGATDECRQEVRYRAADGEYRWAAIRSHGIRDARGGIVGTSGSISDISARIAAVEALADSEHRYRLLAENSNDMIVRIGLDGVRRYVSPASRSLLGFEPEELVGATPASDIHPEDRARVIEVCNSLLTGAAEPMCVYRQRRKDGRYAWLEATYRLIRDPESGTPQELIASVRDISRRQTAELAAAEAMARMHEGHRLLTMAEGMAHVGHWRIDAIQQSLFWSAEVYRIYGLEPDHVPILQDAIAAYHADDRAMVADVVQRATEDGGDFEFAARLVRADGEIRHVLASGQAERAPNGAVTGLFGVVQDVTRQARTEAALREGEARYRLLAENATDIIFRLDRDGRYLYVSPAVQALTGFPPEAIVGQDALPTIHREDQPLVVAALDLLWSGRVPHTVVAYRSRCADHGWRWLEANARLAMNEGSREIIGVSRDISDRKRFEADLLAAREAAEAAAGEARQLAETDELTGIASRRMFLRQLDREIAAARELGRPLSVAVFDIDHFKRVNDRHGHAAGDDVLKRVAATAVKILRRGDLVGRIGGEEFAVLMPGEDLCAAAVIGERLRAAIEADAPAGATLPRVTISIGVALRDANATTSGLLAAADAALYEAKRSGRNRLCLAA